MRNLFRVIKSVAFFSLVFVIFFSSCRKKEIFETSPDVKLHFSTDTVKFDTVFTAIGSATHNFIVRNTLTKALRFDHIRLAGGDGSQFRTNIDGRPTTDFKNYELAAGDSLFIFVEVTINPNNILNPFVVEDSVLFDLNGKTQKVILRAIGRNVHLEKERVACNEVWTADKPHLVLNYVYVPAGCNLTIEKGAELYFHKNTFFLVDGTLTVNGTFDQPVLFAGDRLEKRYQDEPGQWIGMVFRNASKNNALSHAIIRNGFIGIEADSLPPDSTPKIAIKNSIIRDMTSAGIACFGTIVDARNTLIYSSGQANVYCELGGTYTFTHCTFENSSTPVQNRQPSIHLGNSDYENTNHQKFPLGLNAAFRNCIVWGSLDDEFEFNPAGSAAFDTFFSHNIIRASERKFNSTNLLNKQPRFKNIFNGKYQLDSLSPAIDAGIIFPGKFFVPKDLEEKTRDSKPDIGAYEF